MEKEIKKLIARQELRIQTLENHIKNIGDAIEILTKSREGKWMESQKSLPEAQKA